MGNAQCIRADPKIWRHYKSSIIAHEENGTWLENIKLAYGLENK